MGGNESCCRNDCSNDICGKGEGKNIRDNTIGGYDRDPYPKFDEPPKAVPDPYSPKSVDFSEFVSYPPNTDVYLKNHLADSRYGNKYQGHWNGNGQNGSARQVHMAGQAPLMPVPLGTPVGRAIGGGYDTNVQVGLIMGGGNNSQDIFGQGCTSVTAAQEIVVMETVCGVEAPNKYRIQPTKGNDQILYCRENSECCERVCCPACRTLTMNVYRDAESNLVLLSMTKRYHCPMIPCAVLPFTCGLCIPCAAAAFQKPAEMVVKDGPEETGNIIGTIFDPPGPAFWCKIDLIIKDKKGQEIYTAGPKTLCSVGQMCACVQGEYVPVKDMSGNEVAYIERKAQSFEECCCNTNRFEINFNRVTNAEHKKLIFAAGFLLDLQYWEQRQNN